MTYAQGYDGYIYMLAFFAGFAALFIYQSWILRKNIASAKSLMYVGYITRKERDDDHEPIDFRIWIEDRPFEVGEEVFEEVKIGDLLAVRPVVREPAHREARADHGRPAGPPCAGTAPRHGLRRCARQRR